ncbi:TetR/AcrR family transcriptional regulator [Paenibacillus sp. URB8-2]|uniref:TetR/AcrR family transcriptional regulator n=1 Tax=Paenibacillus sp. URB8-2 TaxID=2741301 RepID=UPI0015C0B0CE|nr:TetR/AcrR family transcriptional regulator [Paenibacillus sp. URB8-2]BCG60703.1 hypothetical protein PUR_41280 [Paenibacillus sp. URB8-2]
MSVYVDLSNREIVNVNKNRLIDIAIDAFSLKGFSGVSIRDLTREAGIKESSFYNHFRSKEELQETIFANFRVSVAKIMPPVEQLEHIVKAMPLEAFLRQGYLNFMNHVLSPKMEEIWRILYLEQVRNKAAREIYLNEVIGRTLSFMEAAFARYMESGRIPPRPPAMLAAEYQYPLFGMVAEFLLLRLDGKATEDIRGRMEEHVAFFAKLAEFKEGPL